MGANLFADVTAGFPPVPQSRDQAPSFSFSCPFVCFVDLIPLLLFRQWQFAADFFAQRVEFGFEFGQALCLGRGAVLAFAQFFDQSLEGGSITPGRLGIARIHRGFIDSMRDTTPAASR